MHDLGQQLRAQGKRLTSQRSRVLEAVQRLGHATPDEISAEVQADGGSALPASTVYRALDALQDLGLIAHTHVDHRVPSYHLAAHADHVHVMCRGCGWVGQVEVAAAAPLAQAIREQLGFEADMTHAAVHGTCAECTRTRRSE